MRAVENVREFERRETVDGDRLVERFRKAGGERNADRAVGRRRGREGEREKRTTVAFFASPVDAFVAGRLDGVDFPTGG